MTPLRLHLNYLIVINGFKTRNIGDTLLIMDDTTHETREVPNLECSQDDTLEFSFE